MVVLVLELSLELELEEDSLVDELLSVLTVSGLASAFFALLPPE